MRKFLLALALVLAAALPARANQLLPTGALHVAGNQIVSAIGDNVRANCVDFPLGSVLGDLVKITSPGGFNCIRVPWYDATLNLVNLDAIVSAAAAQSLRVILVHAGNEQNATCLTHQANGLPYDLNSAAPWNTTNNTDGCGATGTITYGTFKTNWVTVATHYVNNPTVIGFDLHQEPTVAGVGLTAPVNWGGGNGSDILAIYNDTGAAVTAADPSALIIVEGPINKGTLFNGTGNTTTMSDLSLAQAKPVNGGGGALTKATMLTYLKGLEGHHVLYGQYDSPPASNIETDFFTTQSGGKHVAVMGDGYWAFGATGIDNVTAVNNRLIAHWQAGGIPYLNSVFPSPAGGDMSQPVDPVQVTTPGTAQYIALHAMYDQEAAGLQTLQNAGVFLYYRAFFESRFAGFWWGYGTTAWTDALWITLWQQHYNYLTQTKGLTNLIWVFAQGFNAGDGTGNNNYPGDAFVDLVGEDVYNNDAFAVYGGLYNAQISAHPSKLWSMTEWGSGSPSASDMNFDMNILNNSIQNQMPRTSMFQAWSCRPNIDGWCIGNMQNVLGAVANPYALTRENMARPTASGGTTIPANKVVYSAHEFPANVAGRTPDSGASWITASNAAWGYLVSGNIAPVFVVGGASLDNTNGALAAEQAWSSTITSYINGSASGGPVLALPLQGMSNSWVAWGNLATQNPDGTLNTDNTTFKNGQFTTYTQWQFPNAPVNPSITTWNAGDKDANMSLSNQNFTATSANLGGGSTSVRSNSSFTVGKKCGDISTTQISNNWDVGLANATFALNNPNGAGSDTNAIGYDPNSTGGNQGVFFNNVLLSSLAGVPSANGTFTMCVDFGTSSVWFTSAEMRAAGDNWNSSPTADPAAGTGGMSFVGMSCPCFIVYNNAEAGNATLSLGTTAVTLPAGFSLFDTPTAGRRHGSVIGFQ